MVLETDPIVGNVVHTIVTEVGEEIVIIIIMTEITNLTIGLIVGPGIGVMKMTIKGMIDMTIGLITEDIILTKIMEIKDTEIEMQVKNAIGPDLDIGATQGRIEEIGTAEARAEVETGDKGPELFQEIGKIDQGLDQAPMLIQIGIGQDAIDAMNMTTLLENALTSCQIKNRKVLFCNC